VLVINAIIGASGFTLTNDTDIELPLIFDLRNNDQNPKNPKGIENVTLKLLNSEEKLEALAANTKPKNEQSSMVENGKNLA
jgi:hypothetical protein